MINAQGSEMHAIKFRYELKELIEAQRLFIWHTPRQRWNCVGRYRGRLRVPSRSSHRGYDARSLL